MLKCITAHLSIQPEMTGNAAGISITTGILLDPIEGMSGRQYYT